MPIDDERLLPEGVLVTAIVDDPFFFNDTATTEIYTLFRIVRMTHDLMNNPEGWTHRGNITRLADSAIGTALFRIVDREVVDVRVRLAPIET